MAFASLEALIEAALIQAFPANAPEGVAADYHELEAFVPRALERLGRAVAAGPKFHQTRRTFRYVAPLLVADNTYGVTILAADGILTDSLRNRGRVVWDLAGERPLAFQETIAPGRAPCVAGLWYWSLLTPQIGPGNTTAEGVSLRIWHPDVTLVSPHPDVLVTANVVPSWSWLPDELNNDLVSTLVEIARERIGDAARKQQAQRFAPKTPRTADEAPQTPGL